jgi:hypothetical protein
MNMLKSKLFLIAFLTCNTAQSSVNIHLNFEQNQNLNSATVITKITTTIVASASYIVF